jgi:hypothetical protein
LTSTTAVISGTPTTAGTSAFFIQVNDGVVSCNKAYTLEIESSCAAWDTMVWDAESGGAGGAGTFNGLWFQNTFHAVVSSPDASVGDFAALSNTTLPPLGLIYNGPGCNCNLHIEFTRVGNLTNLGGSGVLIQIIPPGTTLVNFPVTSASGSYDIPFSLPDTLGADINLFVIVALQSGVDPGDPTLSSLDVEGTITNV